MDSDRIFSEQEAADVLRRAAQIQQETAAGAPVTGLTYDELKRIAAEAGISEAVLTRAVRAPSKTRPGFLNLVEENERVLDGTLAAEDMTEVIEAINRHGKTNQLTAIGRTLKTDILGRVFTGSVEVSSKEGATRLRVRNSALFPYMAGMHTPLILASVLGPILGSRVSLPLGIAVAVGFLTLGTVLFAWFARMGVQKSRELADDLEQSLAALTKKSMLPSPQYESQELPTVRKGLG